MSSRDASPPPEPVQLDHLQSPTDLPVLSVAVSNTSKRYAPSSASGSSGEFPDGGLQAWLVVLGSFLCMVASFGIMNTLGVLQSHLSTHQLATRSEGDIGWIFGIYSFLAFFGGIQIGPIFDLHGPRYLLWSGTICLIAGLIAFSFSTAYYHFILSFSLLCGVGTSLIFTPAVASIGHWFLKRRAYATGVATTGGSIGGILFPLLLQSLTPRIGFAWGVRVVAFIALTFLVVGNSLIRHRPAVLAGNTSAKIDITAFRDLRFTYTAIGVFLIEWALFVPITYISSFSLATGLPLSFSYQLLAILNTGSVFGRWLPGLAADVIGRFNTMLLTVSFCLITTLAFWLPTSYVPDLAGRKAILIVWALLYGFGSGSGISLTPVCVGQICSTAEYGTKYGTLYCLVSFGPLTGVPIAGEILHRMRGEYGGVIAFTAAAYVGALLFFGAARVVGAGWAWRTIF